MEKQRRTHKQNSPLVLAFQQILIFITYVQTLDASYRTIQKQWTIMVDGERDLRESMLVAWFVDDDNDET